ncbi:MAG: hypothetical protein AUJ74_03670 [Candidatus Omnitrophica bacterium CG1_02_44_16]|nr:MAG: hypothetical protein AUJ74_03670 [Candidatus Omnitrophica bacterium CG1_02_44_16]
MLRKAISVVICFSFIVTSGFFHFAAYAGDDPYYLENEIRETEAKYHPLSEDIFKMESFLQSFNQNMDDLKSAYDEIDKLNKQIRTRLIGNLLKSSVLATMDFFSALTLPLGLYKKVVKIIILDVAVELGSNYLQGSFTDSYYSRTMAPLSTEASKLLPEIEELQQTLTLTIGDIKAMSRLEDKELQETGAIYRKFALVLEHIDKAKKAIFDLSANLTKTKAEIEKNLEDIKPEAERLNKKLEDLYKRLSIAREEKRKTEMAEDVASAKEGVKKAAVPTVPSITAQDPQEALKQWFNIYEAAKGMLEDQVPPLAQQIQDKRKKYDEDYTQFFKGLASKNIIQLNYANIPAAFYWFNMPEEIGASGLTLTQIVERHRSAKNAMEFLKGASSDVKEGIGALGKFKDKIVEIATLEDQLLALQKYAQLVESERRRVGGDDKYNATNIFRALIPKELDLKINTIDRINEAAALKEILSNYDKHIPTMLEIYDKNAKSCEKALPALVKEYETRFAKRLEDLTNANNALSQLEGTAAEYDKLVTAAGWSVKRKTGEGEWYYKGGLRENLKYQFSEAAFTASLEKAVAKENLSDADEAMKKFEKLLDDYKGLERKYSAAWNHYFYYCDEAQAGGGADPYINDFSGASQVKDAILKVKGPDRAKEYTLVWNTVRFGSVWRGLISLPNIDIGLEDISAYKLYTLRKRLALEGRKWLTFNRDDFYKKANEAGIELTELAGGLHASVSVEAAKKDLANIISAYELAHAEAIEKKVPESQGPGPENIDGTQDQNVDYKQLVLAAVKKLSEAYENENVALFADIISKDFTGNRTFLEEGVRFDFDMFTGIRLNIYINRIEANGNKFTADTKWDKMQVPRGTGQQQRTTGNTVFYFVLEDGKIKIINLRGNLIYATLSPEIAGSSGLSQAVIEEIRAAQQTRNPVQPGASQTTEQPESASSSGSLQVKTGTLQFFMPMVRSSFAFVSGTVGPDGSGDITFEINLLKFVDSAEIQNVTGTYTFESLSVCPNIIPGDNIITDVGNVIIFRTVGGYFGKLKITSFSSDDLGNTTCAFQYAVQTDGSKNIKT